MCFELKKHIYLECPYMKYVNDFLKNQISDGISIERFMLG